MHVELFKEYLVLAEELNFHAAARRLNITQSTLSKHIAALEREYGVLLFSRDRFGMSLTSNGAVLLESARTICAEYECSKELLCAGGARKALFIGGELDNPSMHGPVSEAVGIFMRRNSACTPRFVSCGSTALDEQVAALRSGEADCAIFSLDRHELALRPDAGDFLYRLVCRLPVDAMVSPMNPLAAKERLTLADLAGCTLVRLVGPRYSTGWRVLEYQLKAADVSFRTTPLAVNTPYDFIGMDLGASVLLTPRFTAMAGENARVGAQLVPVDEDDLHLDLGALWLRERDSSLVGAFIDALAEALGAELGGRP